MRQAHGELREEACAVRVEEEADERPGRVHIELVKARADGYHLPIPEEVLAVVLEPPFIADAPEKLAIERDHEQSRLPSVGTGDGTVDGEGAGVHHGFITPCSGRISARSP